MRTVIACLLFAGAASLFSQDLPSYAAASAHPKTVVDYFLLCPAITVGDEGDLKTVTGAAMNEKIFEAKKNYLRKGYSTASLKVDSITVDIPHAYIQIDCKGRSYDFALTFVFFDRTGRGSIPAYSYAEVGMDGVSYMRGFFELTTSGAWKDVTSNVLPPVGLRDFEKRDEYPVVQWEYVLPQKGTTVRVFPRMTSEMGRSEGGPDYQFVDRMSKRALELTWDRVKGVFTKGAVGPG